MNKKELVVQQIVESGLLPLYYHENKEISVNILRSLYNSGVRILEYTNRGANATVNFKALKEVAVAEMPGYIQTIKDIFPDLIFMPTGGVEPEEQNLKSWFKAGVSAVGMGSKLLKTDMIDSGNFDALSDYIANALVLIQSSRSTKN